MCGKSAKSSPLSLFYSKVPIGPSTTDPNRAGRERKRKKNKENRAPLNYANSHRRTVAFSFFLFSVDEYSSFSPEIRKRRQKRFSYFSINHSPLSVGEGGPLLPNVKGVKGRVREEGKEDPPNAYIVQ